MESLVLVSDHTPTFIIARMAWTSGVFLCQPAFPCDSEMRSKFSSSDCLSYGQRYSPQTKKFKSY